MLDFIFSLLVLVAVGCFLMAFFKALEQIATHLRGNPDGIKAVIEHVFVPLFAREDRTRRVTLEVVELEQRPEEAAASEQPSRPVPTAH